VRYSLGRTIFTGILAAGLFGLILLVSPRLTYSQESDRSSTPSTTLTGAPVELTVTTTTLPATTTTVPAAATTTTTTGVTTTTVAAVEEWDPASQTPANGYDGSVVLAGLVPNPEFPSDLETVTWTLTVTNAHDGRLWGVYAYVEGFGHAPCDAHILDPGESTTCRVDGPVYTGTDQVVAWVDAWTLERQVSDKVLFELVISA
jgi:hypothetical protein